MEVETTDATEARRLEGLGGWLILVGFGLMVRPLVAALDLVALYKATIASGDYALLATPGTDTYFPEFARLLLIEAFVGIGLLLVCLYLQLLFFTKRRAFRAWFIGVNLFVPAFVIVDHSYATTVLIDLTAEETREAYRQIYRTVIYSLIWVPYMLVSRRVKATFVR